MMLGKEQEVINTIKRGLVEAQDIMREIETGLMNSANQLRVEQHEEIFTALSISMNDLYHLMNFIDEVRKGIEHLKSREYEVSSEPLSCWDKSVDIFHEMLSAFERKDWVTLSDLIEYELQPLLSEGKRGLVELKERLDQ